MTTVGERAISRVDVLDQFQKVGAEVVISALFQQVPRRATVKTGVFGGDVAIYADDYGIVFRHPVRHFGNCVSAVIVVLDRIAVAVPVEVVDHGVTLGAGLVAGRQKDAVMPCLAEDFRVVGAIEERLFRECGLGQEDRCNPNRVAPAHQNTLLPLIPTPGPAPNSPRIVTVRSFNPGLPARRARLLKSTPGTSSGLMQ